MHQNHCRNNQEDEDMEEANRETEESTKQELINLIVDGLTSQLHNLSHSLLSQQLLQLASASRGVEDSLLLNRSSQPWVHHLPLNVRRGKLQALSLLHKQKKTAMAQMMTITTTGIVTMMSTTARISTVTTDMLTSTTMNMIKSNSTTATKAGVMLTHTHASTSS